MFACLFLLLFLRILFGNGGCKSSTQKKDKWRLATACQWGTPSRGAGWPTACQGGTPLEGSEMANCLSREDPLKGSGMMANCLSRGAGRPSLTPVCPVCHTWPSPLRHHCPTQHSDNRRTAPVTEDPRHVDNSSLKNSIRKAQGLTLENRTEASDRTRRTPHSLGSRRRIFCLRMV